MSALNKARDVLLKQWVQSALLHGFLLLCFAVYDCLSDGTLSFSTHSFKKISTGDLTILGDHNTLVVEMFFKQPESTESHELAAKPTGAIPQVIKETNAYPNTDTNTTIMSEAIATAVTDSQHVTAQYIVQTSAQSISRVSALASQTTVKPPQTARPDHAHSPKPVYPLALRDLGVSGVVWLRVWVDSTGRPCEIELAKGSGYRLFDEAALRAVQHWRFVPAKNEQQSLASWVEFAVRFEING